MNIDDRWQGFVDRVVGERGGPGSLAELRRLGGFGKAKLLGTLDAPSKGRHYTG
jgi:hypothetical protein